MDLEQAIAEFLTAGVQGGWSTATRDAYAWRLGRFRAWFGARSVVAVAGLSRAELRAWGAGLRADWAPATVRGSVVVVQLFLRWLVAEGWLAEDLAAALKAPSVPERVQRTLSAAEVAALLAACEILTEHGLSQAAAEAVAARNAALVALLYDTLVRAAELCRLAVQDVDLAGRRLVVRGGKGGADRVALFGPEAGRLVAAWLAVRPVSASPALFTGIGGLTPGAPLTPSGLRLIVRRLGERAGVAGVSPHAFRRGGAAQLILAAVPTRLVQLFGGWAKIEMVELYTRWLALQSEEIVALYVARCPCAAVKRLAEC
jgi:site-specific recombinase XerD